MLSHTQCTCTCTCTCYTCMCIQIQFSCFVVIIFLSVFYFPAIVELLQGPPKFPRLQVPPAWHTQALLHCSQEEISCFKATHSSGTCSISTYSLIFLHLVLIYLPPHRTGWKLLVLMQHRDSQKKRSKDKR